jgi:hypothetical protein
VSFVVIPVFVNSRWKYVGNDNWITRLSLFVMEILFFGKKKQLKIDIYGGFAIMQIVKFCLLQMKKRKC